MTMKHQLLLAILLSVSPFGFLRRLDAGDRAARTPRTQYDAGDPTLGEQLVLESINRARANPNAEGARLRIDINEGLLPADGTPPDLAAAQIQVQAKVQPPLAMNKILLGTARTHSQEMYANNYFAHDDLSAKTPFDRMTAAGYNWNLAGENIAAATRSEEIQLENDLMVDAAMPGRGHRVNLLDIRKDDVFQEVGVGYFHGPAPNTHDYADFITQDFGTSTQGPFVLGVVYDDKNKNDVYDSGEGISGVTVTCDSGNFFAVTSTSGGYAIPVAKTGTITLTFSGGPLALSVAKTITLAGTNVKVDMKASEALPKENR